jgi:hypothetical protein
MSKNEGIARGAMLLAFTAGRWRGQVDLEISYDLEQYGQALAESHCARIICSPCFPASKGRAVTVNLRSDRWREGVCKTTEEEFEKAFEPLRRMIDKLEAENAELRKRPKSKQREFRF